MLIQEYVLLGKILNALKQVGHVPGSSSSVGRKTFKSNKNTLLVFLIFFPPIKQDKLV